MNKSLRKMLSFFGLAEGQADIEFWKWESEQKRKLAAGEEMESPWQSSEQDTSPHLPYVVDGKSFIAYYIEYIWHRFWENLNLQQKKDYIARWKIHESRVVPPWVLMPNSSWVDWRYSNKRIVWKAYWETLSNQEKRSYLEKWRPPDDEWFETWTLLWGADETSDLIEKQREELRDGKEIKPPWTVFPVSFSNYGWNYGTHEFWKLNVWIPFWKNLSESERKKYAEKWQPPDESWKKLIIEDWIKESEKTSEELN